MTLRVIDVSKRFYKGERQNIASTLLRRIAARSDDLFWALRNVSFDVRRGEAYGIIGPNGAGKSTLLKLLSGIMRPTHGRIEISGRLSTLIEVGAGFHPELTGRENVFLNGTVLGMSRNEIKRKFDEIVDFSELERFIDTPVKRYSSGMLARLGFSVAAHVEPEVLLVDEVLSVGDYVFQRKSAAKMRSVLSGGTTVVFVSHDLQAVEEICTRCLLLQQGSVVHEGATPAVVDDYVERFTLDNSDGGQTAGQMRISSIRDADGSERNRFVSGETTIVTIDNDIKSGEPWVLSALDGFRYEVFSVRIPPRDNGQSRSVELTLHLAPGTYQLVAQGANAGSRRMQSPERTIYVSSPSDVRGVVNLYPEFIAP